ncbi:hypothetical protein ACFX2J_010400 [Malus domestica]
MTIKLDNLIEVMEKGLKRVLPAKPQPTPTTPRVGIYEVLENSINIHNKKLLETNRLFVPTQLVTTTLGSGSSVLLQLAKFQRFISHPKLRIQKKKIEKARDLLQAWVNQDFDVGQVAKPTKDVLDAISLLARTCVIPQVHQEALVPHFTVILETHQEFLEALARAEEAKQFIDHHSVSSSIIQIFCDDCTAIGERLNVIYGQVDVLRMKLNKLEAEQNELEAGLRLLLPSN